MSHTERKGTSSDGHCNRRNSGGTIRSCDLTSDKRELPARSVLHTSKLPASASCPHPSPRSGVTAMISTDSSHFLRPPTKTHNMTSRQTLCTIPPFGLTHSNRIINIRLHTRALALGSISRLVRPRRALNDLHHAVPPTRSASCETRECRESHQCHPSAQEKHWLTLRMSSGGILLGMLVM